MDFQSLSRRELQSLCKLNKIPANITNVAMADALQSLENVVGVEEYLNVSQSETADAVEKVEVPSPKAPQTRCRTSTRQRVKTTETELPPTVTRTTRRGSKQPPVDVEESLKTPAVSRTSRKAPATSSRRNVSNQLNECENEAKEEGLVESKYSTRRSTRLTEKKSAAPKGKKGVEKAVKIDSVLDQVNIVETGNSNAVLEDICNAFEKLDVVVLQEEVTLKYGEEDEDCVEVNIPKQESEEISKSCEDGDVEVVSEMKIDEVCDVKPESDGILISSEEATHKSEEEEDEVSNLMQGSHETSNLCEDGDVEDDLKISEVKTDEVYDVKPESDGISSPTEVEEDEVKIVEISSPCEDESSEQNLNVGEEVFDAVEENNFDTVSAVADAEFGHEDTLCVDAEMNNQVTENNESPTMVGSMIIDNTESPIDETATMVMEDMPEPVDETVVVNHSTMTEEVEETATMEMEDMSEPVYETVVNNHSTITEEVEEVKHEVVAENNVTEKSDADPLILSEVMSHPTQVTLVKSATPFKNIVSIVTDDKENIVDEGKNTKKEKDEIKSLNDFSIRQLKKQLKALTLKGPNSKASEVDAAAVTIARPALQTLCEKNQMVVGGETEI